ncbi:uncharacterized protein LTR77_007034 [Saxophila tyrrhenica]|uniref:Uncharacterized protein n=1 Tax=Saxophila tyrrhenica TaxID=1690608 RepID=A0AAV9P7J6_9PEZI|nr:hypothetical protein LTR77_007034 [Saxophila tyrrhenica]
MSNIIKKIERKLGDHPNVSDDPNVNPSSGTGQGANDGNNPNKSWVQNKIEAGQGSGSPNDRTARAGSTTIADIVSAADSGGVAGDGKGRQS